MNNLQKLWLAVSQSQIQEFQSFKFNRILDAIAQHQGNQILSPIQEGTITNILKDYLILGDNPMLKQEILEVIPFIILENLVLLGR